MFDWDEANRAHIAEHAVSPFEAEEALRSNPVELRRQTRKGEERWMQIGTTSAGRILIVVTTRHGERTRVVTAFPANRAYRAFYAAQKERIDHGNDQGTTGNP